MTSKQTKLLGSPKAQPLAVLPVQQAQQILTMEMLQDAFKKLEERMLNTLTSTLITMLEGKIQSIEEEIEGVRKEMGELASDVYQKVDKVNQNIKFTASCTASYLAAVDEEIIELKQISKKMGKKYEVGETKWDNAEKEIMMIQYREMEYAIRIRGLKENKGEDLREIFVTMFAEMTDETKNQMDWRIEKIYRVNSWVARNRQLPRDIVVYFNSRKLRNDILQYTFKNKLKVERQELLVLKELPSKMLRVRKEYKFLVEELKKQQIQYKWETPEGLSLVFSGRRYRLNSVEKAKDFFYDILKAEVPESEDAKKEKEGEQMQGAVQTAKDGAVPQIEIKISEEPKDQRQTKAATKRREEVIVQKQQIMMQESAKGEAVGGDRPKKLSREQA